MPARTGDRAQRVVSAMQPRPNVTEADVRDVLEGIVDPCSIAMGAPAGLVSLGLVRDVTIRPGAGGDAVDVRICITEPGCLMGGLFTRTARERLAALPGVTEVTVDVDHSYLWEPGDMDATYRERLDAARARRLEALRLERETNAV